MNTLDRFDGAAVWAGLPAEQQARIGAIALELLASWYAQEKDYDGFFDEETPLVRAANAADVLLINELREALVDAVSRDVLEVEGQARLPSMLGPVCRACGCSQNDACAMGCGWAGPDLCTACDVDPINLAGSGPVPVTLRED